MQACARSEKSAEVVRAMVKRSRGRRSRASAREGGGEEEEGLVLAALLRHCCRLGRSQVGGRPWLAERR